MKLIRKLEVCDLLGGVSPSQVDRMEKDGFVPARVRFGERACGWPVAELEQVMVLRAAGAGDDEVRDLVGRLHAKRQELAAQIRQTAGGVAR